MPINVIGNSSSSYDNGNKVDTSLFVQKPYLRTKYIESNIEQDIDLKNQYRIKNSPDPISKQEAASKNYVDNKFNDSRKNTQPLLKHVHHQKGTKFNFLDYQLQFIEAHQFIKLNGQEGDN